SYGFCGQNITVSCKKKKILMTMSYMRYRKKVTENAQKHYQKVWEQWKVCDFKSLPDWLQDNDYLHLGHRPPLPSFKECFRSIFRIHTETGNIWTHLIGCLMFIMVTTYFWVRTDLVFDTKEKIIFTFFFVGAIGCLGLSFTFHTVSCHSETVGKFFSKLDYVGITLLIVGSFVPWLYYGFYCEYLAYVIYLSLVITLGVASMIVSLFDQFSQPEYRSIRASVFICFGATGVIPAIHSAVSMGWLNSIYQASLGWIILMGVLYIGGAVLYALRIPERFYPGKCDIWFHSHQIFHVLVICAAFVHYHGISEMAVYRMSVGECTSEVEVS
ncbi:hypothetical protein QYM36_001704, partial [Artemia franciscana]